MDDITFKQQQILLDHDMLVRVDENIKNLIVEFSKFKDITNILETRLRVVEDAIVKLAPIPSVSHEQVVKDIAFLNSRVDLLIANKEKLIGGWKALSFLFGMITVIIGVVYYITIIVHPLK